MVALDEGQARSAYNCTLTLSMGTHTRLLLLEQKLVSRKQGITGCLHVRGASGLGVGAKARQQGIVPSKSNELLDDGNTSLTS